MLTLEYILKVARLLDQTGEPRAGFLLDEASNIEGYHSQGDAGVLTVPNEAERISAIGDEDVIALDLAYEVDEQTGDLRLVQK